MALQTNQILDDARSWALRRVVMPAGDRLFGQRTMKRLDVLERMQWWDRARLLDERDRQLRTLVDVAYREVPFYRDHFDKAGVRPTDITCAADLTRLPIVTKALMRPSYPHGVVRDTGARTYETSSSGSTGTNFFVTEDRETASHYRAAFLLALGWSGWRMGEAHLQTGITPDRSFDKRLKDYFLRCRYMSAYVLTDGALDAALDALDSDRVKFLWGFPGSLYAIASRAVARGSNIELDSVVTWGDTLYPFYRETIERAFKTRVFDTYGCGEGIQVAAQCGTGSTYHVHTPDTIVECVDDDGNPVPVGQPGNILLTRLHPGPMPFLRYQIGDAGTLMAGECACGRGYELFDSVQGRDTDIVLTPNGNRLIVHFFTGILEHFDEIARFQIVQRELESITIRVVANGAFSPETSSAVVERLRQRGATDVRIDVEVVDEIPLPPNGKRRFVISEISKPSFNG